MAKTAVSPTFTGPLPHLEVDLTNCELGDPCRKALGVFPAYCCRIHLVRQFFESIGWVAEAVAAKKSSGERPDAAEAKPSGVVANTKT